MEIVETEFRFNGRIKTPLLSGESVELLEIDTLTKFGEKGIRNTYWVDSTGRQKKSYLSLFDLRSFECSESEAKAIQALAELDATPSARLLSTKESPTESRSNRFRIESKWKARIPTVWYLPAPIKRFNGESPTSSRLRFFARSPRRYFHGVSSGRVSLGNPIWLRPRKWTATMRPSFSLPTSSLPKHLQANPSYNPC